MKRLRRRSKQYNIISKFLDEKERERDRDRERERERERERYIERKRNNQKETEKIATRRYQERRINILI